MGGSPGSNTNQYEPERVGVNKRRYGELADNGFQSIDQYNSAQSFIESYNPNIQQYEKVWVQDAPNDYTDPSDLSGHFEQRETEAWLQQQSQMEAAGLTYNKDFNRWTLANGVDYEAAKKDWSNYQMEREDIAKYSASEERRKTAPADLTGTSGNVDYDLSIKDDEEDKTKTTTVSAVDTSPSTASTSQVLGIY